MNINFSEFIEIYFPYIQGTMEIINYHLSNNRVLAPVAPQQSEGSVSGKPVAAALPELKEMK